MIVANLTGRFPPACSHFNSILAHKKSRIISTAVILLMGLSLSSGLMAAAVTFWSPADGCAAIAGTWYSDGNEDTDTDTCTMTQDRADTITIPFGNTPFTLDGAGYEIQGLTLGADSVVLKNIKIDAQGAGTGLFIFEAHHVTVTNLEISNTPVGILLRGSGNNVITNNSISINGSSAHSGVWFDPTTVGNFPDETFLGSNQNELKDNVITANGSGEKIGVRLGSFSQGNDISGNTISNLNWGLKVMAVNSTAHEIHQNNFIDNSNAIGASPSNGDFDSNYYSTYDEAIEGCFDSGPQDGVCDDGYTFVGGAVDNLPWTTVDGGSNMPDAATEVTAAAGGTVSTIDQSVVIDVGPNSVDGDTTIEVYVEQVTNPDIIVGNNDYFDTALAIYQFSPDGTTFDPEALLTLSVDVSGLTESERSLISIYRQEDTDGDDDIDANDGFRMIAGTVCSIEESSDTAICVAPIDHFSKYAIILLSDSDEDGVPDSDDLCPDTSPDGFDANGDGCFLAFTQCTVDQYERTPPSQTSDRYCEAISTCTVDQYEFAPPTSSSNRMCACKIAIKSECVPGGDIVSCSGFESCPTE